MIVYAIKDNNNNFYNIYNGGFVNLANATFFKSKKIWNCFEELFKNGRAKIVKIKIEEVEESDVKN